MSRFGGLHRGYLILGLAAYLAFVLINAPAAHLYAWSKDALQGMVQLEGVSGTIWDGHVDRLAAQGVSVDNLNWRLLPGALLSGEAAARVRMDGGDAGLQVSAHVSWSGGESVQLKEVSVRGPLEQLQRYAPAMPPGYRGNVTLDLDWLTLDNGRIASMQGRGRIANLYAGVPLNAPLGDFSANLEAISGGLRVKLASLPGAAVELEATLNLSTGGGYRLRGVIQAAQKAAPQLKRNIGYLGKSGPGGRTPMNFSGVVPGAPW
ncbi:type II secretion system protein N [Magnetofaba australis]|nr:type II secretion system protein N [Magnetofaba australis]